MHAVKFNHNLSAIMVLSVNLLIGFILPCFCPIESCITSLTVTTIVTYLILIVIAMPRNEIVFLVLLLLGFYENIFLFNHLIGTIDYHDYHIIIRLENLGFDGTTDLFYYQQAFLLFRCVSLGLLLVLLPTRSRIDWSMIDILPEHHTFAIAGMAMLVLLVHLIQKEGSSIALLAIGKSLLIYYLMLWLAIKFSRPGLSRMLIWGMMIVGSFWVTRSRNFAGVMILYYMAFFWNTHFGQNQNANKFCSRIKNISIIGVLCLGAFIFVSLYEVYRDNQEKTLSYEALATSSRFGVEGEGGITYAIGAHIASLHNDPAAVGILQDSFYDKLVRSIPGISKGSMQADRYVKQFFPDIASGGGLAYPLIGEACLYGGFPAVIGMAILFAVGIRILVWGATYPLWRVALLSVMIGCVRSELSLSLFLVVNMSIWVGGIYGLGMILPRARGEALALPDHTTPTINKI